MVKWLQAKHFGEELERLRKGCPVKRLSKLRALGPIIDQFGLLRVGGRLGDAYDRPHPVILPREGLIVKKLLFKVHREINHGGP